ncbi:MAG: GNAT family protein [Steroidobacteraceae bacterium]
MTAEKEFPQFLATQRLDLRPYVNADALMLWTLIEGNRDLLQRNFAPLTKALAQLAGATNFVTESTNKWKARKEYVFGVWQRTPHELVGQIKIKNIAWEIPAAELSYFISRFAHRQGFATEALEAVVVSAFDALHFERLFLRIIASNIESVGLAKKLGFRREGLHRSDFRCGFDQLHDVYSFARLRRDPVPRLW